MTTTDISSAQRLGATRNPHLLAFIGLVLVLCAAQWGALTGMVHVWWGATTYNHGFLVVPAALYLVWRRREELAQAAPRMAPSALAPLTLFALFGALGALGGVDVARHAGFVGCLMALVPLCFGWALTRRFWFPALFLLFMIPVGDFLIASLQELTADASVWLLRLTGIAVYREGLMIELPSGLWEVAEACAGLRFLIANIFVAALFAYLSYDKAWKWAVFAVLAVAVPVGANCLRAYGIMLLAHVTDNALAVGVDHLVYGWVFFSVVMLAMLWLGGLFADRQIDDPAPAPMPQTAAPAHARWPLAALAAAALIAPSAALAMTEPQPRGVPEAIAAALAPEGWTRAQFPEGFENDWKPRIASADKLEVVRFEKDGRWVDLLVAWYTHQRDDAEATHWANRFEDDDIWKRAGLGMLTLDTGASALPSPARRDAMTKTVHGDGASGVRFARRIVASWYWSGGALTADPGAAKLNELRARLAGGESAAAVVALSALHDAPEKRAETLATLEAALTAMPDVGAALSGMAR